MLILFMALIQIVIVWVSSSMIMATAIINGNQIAALMLLLYF